MPLTTRSSVCARLTNQNDHWDTDERGLKKVFLTYRDNIHLKQSRLRLRLPIAVSR
jgi:hypothetical protein